jgi:undecaprenyl-phosphate 4-deoxy-4-formamido-L-arabinose transferase
LKRKTLHQRIHSFGKINPMNCSVVVPVYRGEATISALVENLALELPKIAESYEATLVNDCSPDSSWEKIQELARRFPWVVGINLMRNYGQHNATLCGVRAARYEITVTMDDDLQHPPKEISVLVAELEKGFDVVYGAPRTLPNGFWRNQVTKYTKWLLAQVMGIPSVQNISSFRAFRTLDVLLSWGTSRFTSVTVDIDRSDRESNYNFASLIRQAILILTGYSTTPLRLASWLGFVMTLFGVGVFVYVLTIYFTQGSLPGFPFLASLVALLNGTELLAIGIFGEYLARVFERSVDRPTYVVREQIGGEAR